MIDEKEFLMALFIRSGSVSDPEKLYHLDFVCDSPKEAEMTLDAIGGFGITAKLMHRKGKPVVYLKDSESISDMLALLGAHNALLHYENVRVVKEMRGTVQRRVNFETANINKTVSASLKQAEDIELIRDRIGLMNLPDQLREIAELRLEFPEATLQELSDRIPEVGPYMTMRQAIDSCRTFDHIFIPYENAVNMEETKKLFAAVRPGERIAVFIGPEGGFEEAEVQAVIEAGGRAVTLGKRILRTETAGMTVLSILMFGLEQ